MKTHLLLLTLCFGLALSGPVAETSEFVFNNETLRSGATIQSIILYDYDGQSGESHYYKSYTSNMGNFNNRASSYTINSGIWIMYDNDNFQGRIAYVWGDNYSHNMPPNFDNQASSLRYAGPPDGYKYDTINFYQYDGFRGKEQYFYNDAPTFNYNDFGRSIILTGCSPWTIYQNSNYGGYHVCLYPEDTSKCSPSFFTSSAKFGGMAGQVSSARKGCHTRRILRAKPVPSNTVMYF